MKISLENTADIKEIWKEDDSVTPASGPASLAATVAVLSGSPASIVWQRRHRGNILQTVH